MSKKTLFFLAVLLLVIAGITYVFTDGNVLQSRVLISQDVNPLTPSQPTISTSTFSTAPIRTTIVASQPTQGEQVHFDVIVENPQDPGDSSSTITQVYGVGFDVEYPSTLTVPSEAPVLRYNTLLLESADIEATQRLITYRGYSGTPNTPVVLNPGEKKVVFGFVLQSAKSVNISRLQEKLVIKKAQIITEDPVSSTNQLQANFALNASDIDVPINLYPEGDPDVNFDGVVNNLDVQYLFEFWRP